MTVVVTDRLYARLEYFRDLWGMDSWSKVIENMVKITSSLIEENGQ